MGLASWQCTQLTFKITYLLTYFVWGNTCVHACDTACVCVEARGQLSRVVLSFNHTGP